VQGTPIGEDEVVAFIDRWLPVIERTGATFFEATTAMAFAHFAERKIDVAVVEVGLGGRLDATNVIRPLAAAVTSIGMDHTEYLGATLPQIAFEKAGIFKAGAPAIIGERDEQIARDLHALAMGAGADPVVDVPRDRAPELLGIQMDGTRFRLHHPESGELRTPLVGEHQAFNAAVAIAMLESAGPAYARAAALAPSALDRVTLPGRFQREGRLILDVSHNLEGVEALCANLIAAPPERPLTAVVSILTDKPWREMLTRLAGLVDTLILTLPASAPADRLWPLDTVAAFAATLGVPVHTHHELDDALARALGEPGTTLITGSFHTVGDAMSRLQVSPASG
jgi:dihydrofolate synthase / folylpolyglutamate synthase